MPPCQDPKTENNPYLGFLYTSFQERATAISHGNTARQAKDYGDKKLAVMSGLIASDEKRHERAYGAIVEKLFELDPNGAMLAFEDMMKKKVSLSLGPRPWGERTAHPDVVPRAGIHCSSVAKYLPATRVPVVCVKYHNLLLS